MKQIIRKSTRAMAMIGLALAFNTSVYAADAGTSGGLQHRVMLYGWFPGVDGSLNYDIPGSGDNASDILDGDIDFAFMGLYEGRMDEWSFTTDLMYLDMSNSDNNVIDRSMTAWVLGLYGGYNVVQTNKVSLDIIAGLRYLSIEADAELPVPPGVKLSNSVDLWDGIIGVKGYINLSEKWYLPYNFDIGAGDSDLTWQALVGVGYRLNWGDILLAYRHMGYDEGSSGFVHDLELSGLAAGVSFRF